MNYRALAAVLLTAPLVATACGRGLSPRTARSQIASLGGSGLVPADVNVERIITQAGDRMIAETTVKMAFEFEREAEGDWRIVAARLGDRQWVDVSILVNALQAERRDSTTLAIRKLIEGVEAFRNRNGGALPEFRTGGDISDFLHPAFMSELIREDAWGGPILYEPTNGSYQLRSAGADRVRGTADDMVLGPQSDRTLP